MRWGLAELWGRVARTSVTRDASEKGTEGDSLGKRISSAKGTELNPLIVPARAMLWEIRMERGETQENLPL